MDSNELEQLVDAIATRVQARLGGAAATDHPSECSDCTSCQLPSDQSCDTCGLNVASPYAAACSAPKTMPSPAEIARYIDHTHLKPDADRDTIQRLCEEARQHQFFSVCVNSGNAHLASRLLAASTVKVCAVVGFPLGAAAPAAKGFEAREAVRCGASEIDMVMNIGALRSLDYSLVLTDIARVVKSVPGKIVKVILEVGMLTDEEIAISCALAKSAGAHFVKTSTGFGPGGATVGAISLMRKVVGPEVGVKASGGVGDYETACKMLQAGANRIGASSSVAIVTGGRGTGGY